MSFSDLVSITSKDMAGVAYRGRKFRESDVISVDRSIRRIVFRTPLSVKALNFSSKTEVFITGDSKVTHVMSAGRLICVGNFFCGSIDSGGDVIIDGDLSVWLGNVDIENGNLCVSGDLSVSGDLNLQNGVALINGEADVDGHVKAEMMWSGKSGDRFPDSAVSVAVAAEKRIRSVA